MSTKDLETDVSPFPEPFLPLAVAFAWLEVLAAVGIMAGEADFDCEVNILLSDDNGLFLDVVTGSGGGNAGGGRGGGALGPCCLRGGNGGVALVTLRL